MKVPLAGALAIVALLAFHARPAEACSPPWPQPHVLDPAHADDVTPPSPPGPLEDAEVFIYRSGSGYAGYGCNGGGTIEIFFDASDDRTPWGRLGFEWRLVAGGGAGIAARAGVWNYGTNSVRLFFTDEGQAFDLEVELVAVDLNGNRSAPVRLRIQADAVDAGGCSAGGGSSRTGAILGLLASVLVGLRSRGGRGRRGARAHRA